MSEQVFKRLTNAMRQLKREVESTGGALPDCEFTVKMAGGDVEISPMPNPDPAANPSLDPSPYKGREENAEEREVNAPSAVKALKKRK